MQRVYEGKEPLHTINMLHVMSLHNKTSRSRVAMNVVDRPFYAAHGSSVDISSSLGRRRALATPEVPRLSKVIVRKSVPNVSEKPVEATTNDLPQEAAGIT